MALSGTGADSAGRVRNARCKIRRSMNTRSGNARRSVEQRVQGEAGLFMIATYCTLKDAQWAKGNSSVTLDHVLAAAERIAKYSGRPLLLRDGIRWIRRIELDGRYVFPLPAPVSAITEVIGGAAGTGVDYTNDYQLEGPVITIPSVLVPDAAIQVTANWGDGGLSGALAAPSALTATAREIAEPTAPPAWWTPGQTVLWGDEQIVFGEVDGSNIALLRFAPDAHLSGVTVREIRPSAATRIAAIGIARRLQWYSSEVSAQPSWARLLQGFEEMIK